MWPVWRPARVGARVALRAPVFAAPDPLAAPAAPQGAPAARMGRPTEVGPGEDKLVTNWHLSLRGKTLSSEQPGGAQAGGASGVASASCSEGVSATSRGYSGHDESNLADASTGTGDFRKLQFRVFLELVQWHIDTSSINKGARPSENMDDALIEGKLWLLTSPQGTLFSEIVAARRAGYTCQEIVSAVESLSRFSEDSQVLEVASGQLTQPENIGINVLAELMGIRDVKAEAAKS